MKQSSINNSSYRSDIDGLRAIAIVSVIIYHIEPSILSGGFVGVDIFFVISGFLITSLIRKQVIQDTFTFKQFYIKRLRRIAPALLFMLLVSSIAAFIFLQPAELHSFSKSLATQVLSLQNIIFFLEGEYFLGSASKPLLHTWSLAIEEQFYLFWPLVLLFTKKWKNHNILLSLLVIIIVSFILNLVGAKISPKSSFFLLPMRAWELAAGGVLVILLEKYPFNRIPEKIRGVISWFGLILVLLSISIINDTMTFPGYVAIYPVIGTMLLIIMQPNLKSWLGSLLSNKIIVYIGLLSYSLYLWHWPVLAYAHYLDLNLSNVRVLFSTLLLIILLSYFSYTFVELPIRKKNLLSTSKKLLTVIFSIFLILGLSSAHILNTQGAAYRYNKQSQPFLTTSFNSRSGRCGAVWQILHLGEEVCELTITKSPQKNVLLWGNSHSDMWSNMLIELAQENQSNLYLNVKNCRATTDSSFCNGTRQKKILDFIVKYSISDVILSSTWYGSYGIDDTIFENMLTEIVAQLHKMQIKVWLVIDIPGLEDLNPLLSYSKNSITPVYSHIPYQDYQNKTKNKEINLFNKIILKFNNASIIDPSSAYCNMNYCSNGANSELWYRDSNHVTNTGAFAAKNIFLNIFNTPQFRTLK